jgi:magnesium-protoporphyrin IX monomethyl ester (oxidative) cyclase
MKVLLIIPPTTVYEPDPSVATPVTPLGLGYLAAFLEKNNVDVKILDALAEGGGQIKATKKTRVYGLSDKQIENRLEEYKPDLVGITSMFTAYSGDVHRVANLVKEYNRKTTVVLGGAHACIFPELILRDKNVDLVSVGEGEVTLMEIIKTLKSKRSLDEIPGTVTRIGKRIIRNTVREFITDLDDIPFPARHLLPMEVYFKAASSPYAMRKPATNMITSRGCPGHCVYCSIHSIWGHRWRARSTESVLGEIELLVNKYKIREIDFMDDSMSVDRNRLEAICDGIITRKIDIRWTTPNGIAHWTLNKHLIEKMKEAGCYRITFGIESGNQETRKFLGKPYPLSQARELLIHANKTGMWTICTNILGFPYETRNQMQDTVNFAVYSDTDLAVFYLLQPYPGTPVYEIFKNEKLLNLDYVFSPKKLASSEFSRIGRILAGRGTKTKNFNGDELRNILSTAYRTFIFKRAKSFLNPLRLLRKIHSLEDFAYAIRIIKTGSASLLRLLRLNKFAVQMLYRDVRD